MNESLSYSGPDGINYESELEYLCLAVLGFCGCGMPENTAAWVLEGLDIINEPFEHDEKEWLQLYGDWKDRVRKHYGDNDGSRYFFWYWCADKEFTEHGGSVPGWLTDKGKDLRDRLRELLK